METYQLTKKDALHQRRWYVVDADGKILGRLASEVANVLRGKNKPTFSPHVDAGDFVVVVNARGVRLTGRKPGEKVYYRHTEYPGGIRATLAEKMLSNKPETLIRLAVRGMLPKNRLGRKLLTKLKVYADGEHPHRAQDPKPLLERR
jgi:large subunit ribosomal protein L13